MCRVVIQIKLEFSASVGFIHKKSLMLHGHTILKIMHLVYKKCFYGCVVVEFQLIYCVLNETVLVKIVS